MCRSAGSIRGPSTRRTNWQEARGMPIPTPRPDESTDEFIERCMADETMVAEYPNEDQRLAICHSQLEGERMKTGSIVKEVRMADIWAVPSPEDGEGEMIVEGRAVV